MKRMEADFLLQRNSFYIEDMDTFVSGIWGIIELGDELNKLGDRRHREDSFYNFVTPHGDIAKVSSDKNILGRDLMRSFCLFLDRSKKLSEDCKDLKDFSKVVGNDHVGFIGIPSSVRAVDESSEVTDKHTLLKFHRRCLTVHPPDKDSFRCVIHKYFPNIHLHKDVHKNLNSLHKQYKKIFKTIIHHLEVINDDFFNTFQEHSKKGASYVCTLLKPKLDSRIEISRDSSGIQDLQFDFENSSGESIVLDCHLHTKFKGYWELEGKRDRGDRVYFRQPDQAFHGGKVLVARIGRHCQ